MREIKFRFWSIVLDNFIVPDDSIFVGALKDPLFKVMQYTGLKDKNGVEIYEGDIVSAKLWGGYVERVNWDGPPDVIGEVFWDYVEFRLRAKGERDFRYSDFDDFFEGKLWEALSNMSRSHSEVIGNIYENGNLLK